MPQRWRWDGWTTSGLSFAFEGDSARGWLARVGGVHNKWFLGSVQVGSRHYGIPLDYRLNEAEAKAYLEAVGRDLRGREVELALVRSAAVKST